MVLYKDVPAEAPVPADEQQRFNQLCSYNILDTVGILLRSQHNSNSSHALKRFSRCARRLSRRCAQRIAL